MTAVGQHNDFQTDSRWYVDPVNQRAYESVTNIIGTSISKPWLTAWAAKLAAEYAIDHHAFIGETIREVGRDAAVDLIKGAARRLRELKADIGSHQHDVVESLVKDKPLPSVPAHLVDAEVEGERVDHDLITDGFLAFVEDHNPTFILAEATVANTRLGYAGTLDLVVTFPMMKGRTACLDVKSGKILDVGMVAQLAAYREADEVWVDEMGNKAPMPKTDFGGILHLRPEYERGYKLYELPEDGGRALAWFTTMTAAFHGLKSFGNKPHLRALYPPLADGSQPPPMLEDTGLRCRSSLITAGHRHLDELARLTATDLIAIKGVGPKAVDDVVALLAEHGLTLEAEVA